MNIVRELQDDDPIKVELLRALQDNLSVLREEVKDNMNLTLLSSLVVDLEPIAEDLSENTDDRLDHERDGEKRKREREY